MSRITVLKAALQGQGVTKAELVAADAELALAGQWLHEVHGGGWRT